VSTPLPPGQREAAAFHRFGLTQFANRFPKETSSCVLDVVGNVARELHLTDALLGLPRVEQVCDFHCVTTWSFRALRWEGVRFIDFYTQVVLPQAAPDPRSTLVALRGQDGARTGMLLEDLLAPDVLLADRLNGQPIPVEHGAPLRLIAPAHYAYKSVKYLSRIEFRHPATGYRVSGLSVMDHHRARVAYEERGRVLPGWLLRHLYRPLIAGTVARFAKANENRNTRPTGSGQSAA
jgi:DMSO/TMAO reductase YedYZ molybdopterin-dependent catalytic subunit